MSNTVVSLSIAVVFLFTVAASEGLAIYRLTQELDWCRGANTSVSSYYDGSPS